MQTAGGRQWVIAALLAQILFAVSNFLVGAVGIEASEKSSAGFSCAALRCLGCGINSVLITVVLVIRGQADLLSNLNEIKAIAVGAGALLGAGEYVFSYGLASDGRNGAFISAVLPLNAILVSVLSLSVLNERITLQQVPLTLLPWLLPMLHWPPSMHPLPPSLSSPSPLLLRPQPRSLPMLQHPMLPWLLPLHHEVF